MADEVDPAAVDPTAVLPVPCDNDGPAVVAQIQKGRLDGEVLLALWLETQVRKVPFTSASSLGRALLDFTGVPFKKLKLGHKYPDLTAMLTAYPQLFFVEAIGISSSKKFHGEKGPLLKHLKTALDENGAMMAGDLAEILEASSGKAFASWSLSAKYPSLRQLCEAFPSEFCVFDDGLICLAEVVELVEAAHLKARVAEAERMAARCIQRKEDEEENQAVIEFEKRMVDIETSSAAAFIRRMKMGMMTDIFYEWAEWAGGLAQEKRQKMDDMRTTWLNAKNADETRRVEKEKEELAKLQEDMRTQMVMETRRKRDEEAKHAKHLKEEASKEEESLLCLAISCVLKEAVADTCASILEKHGVLAINNKKIDQSDQAWEEYSYQEKLTMANMKKKKIFNKLPISKLMKCVQRMNEVQYAAWQDVIVEGEVGDKYYVIAKGSCDIIKDGVGIVATQKDGDGFGELALINDEPRGATVRTREACSMMVLNKADFDAILKPQIVPAIVVQKPPAERSPEELERLSAYLANIKFFQAMPSGRVLECCRRMYYVKMNVHDTAISQGDSGTTFWVVLSGSVDVHVRGAGVVASLKAGFSFGEVALIKGQTRNASIICKETCEFMVMDKSDFEELLKDSLDTSLLRTLSISELATHLISFWGVPFVKHPLRRSYPSLREFLGTRNDLFYIAEDKVSKQRTGSITFNHVPRGSERVKEDAFYILVREAMDKPFGKMALKTFHESFKAFMKKHSDKLLISGGYCCITPEGTAYYEDNTRQAAYTKSKPMQVADYNRVDKAQLRREKQEIHARELAELQKNIIANATAKNSAKDAVRLEKKLVEQLSYHFQLLEVVSRGVVEHPRGVPIKVLNGMLETILGKPFNQLQFGCNVREYCSKHPTQFQVLEDGSVKLTHNGLHEKAPVPYVTNMPLKTLKRIVPSTPVLPQPGKETHSILHTRRTSLSAIDLGTIIRDQHGIAFKDMRLSKKYANIAELVSAYPKVFFLETSSDGRVWLYDNRLIQEKDLIVDICRNLIVTSPGMNLRLSELGRQLTGAIDGPFSNLACCRYFGSLEKFMRDQSFSSIKSYMWPRYEDLMSVITGVLDEERIISIRRLEAEQMPGVFGKHPTSRFKSLSDFLEGHPLQFAVAHQMSGKIVFLTEAAGGVSAAEASKIERLNEVMKKWLDDGLSLVFAGWRNVAEDLREERKSDLAQLRRDAAVRMLNQSKQGRMEQQLLESSNAKVGVYMRKAQRDLDKKKAAKARSDNITSAVKFVLGGGSKKPI